MTTHICPSAGDCVQVSWQKDNSDKGRDFRIC